MKEDIHHLVKDIQTAERCIYCSNSLKKEDWFSELYGAKHYKQNKCDSCGKLTKIVVNFDGSLGKGDDTWVDRVTFIDNLVR